MVSKTEKFRKYLKMSIDSDFQQYHADNPHIYRLFTRFAERALDAGFATYSSKSIFERLRWHMHFDSKDKDDFKINNNYTSRYARMLMEDDPRFDGFFRTRGLHRY